MKRASDGLLDGIEEESRGAPLALIIGVLLVEAAVVFAAFLF